MPVFQAHVTAEMPAFIALLLLCIPAYFVLQGRDPRTYVVGVLAAAMVWFVAFYPNFAEPARAHAAVADPPRPAADLELGLPIRREPRPAQPQSDQLAECGDPDAGRAVCASRRSTRCVTGALRAVTELAPVGDSMPPAASRPCWGQRPRYDRRATSLVPAGA